ncbi:MAG: serine/threonine protein kinase [Piscinibacter sp.]|uniref:serine/threonine-protein kinase n=1 Tax=Piscinibacter sp. TaxID=1903157 RepID=UPI001B7569F8|nr:serine/threonine protein kinase [Piscinibacter sp.]MBP6028684.1 serine/threonine protein kinase [Piscinibacter sp.]
MNQATVLGGLGLALSLAFALVHLLWGLPRLSARWAWALTGTAALAALLGAAVAGVLWPLPAALALLFGHAGHELGAARARRADVVPAPATPPAAASAPPRDEATAARPATLGRYRIESEIGRGSMGAVYLGRDPQIGRQVAIKTLALGREFGADKLVEARERFFREAETAGRLQHPDIVTIFDAGEAGELAWIAMEYVKGGDLQRFTVPGRLLPAPQVLEIVARVAEALSYAHSQGVVHRDIKPANVMVDTEGSSVKVMDFGVARVDDASRTRTGIVLGTPSFMSPEQMSGRRTDGRSDLYSLGVMLFQLLTGTLPFEGGSMAELMRRIVNEPAPDVRGLRPELPQALADVVALALEKRPEVRYADGVQMAQDLRAVAAAMLAPEPPQAVQEDAFEKTVTFARIEPRHNSAS